MLVKQWNICVFVGLTVKNINYELKTLKASSFGVL